MKRLISAALIVVMAMGAAFAQLNIPSDGSDGALDVPAGSGDYIIDLGQATTASWDTPSPNAGRGVYDPEKWAVVFKYTSVNIPVNRTVKFTNHPSGAPVVWLVQGNVTINGTLNLNGADSTSVPRGQTPPGGPGGYRGGGASPGGTAPNSDGFGPGGGLGTNYYWGGSYGTQGNWGGTVYNNSAILPLMGGSGGGAWNHNGGGGGGAILMGAAGTITLNGTLEANGGSRVNEPGGGSGGAIRLIANQLTGGINARLHALGGDNTGGFGRIRVEVNQNSYAGLVVPDSSSAPPASPPLIWLPENAPSIKVLSVAGTAVPSDPRSSFIGNTDVTISEASAVTVRMETKNVPSNWSVYVRVVPRNGRSFIVNATRVSGNDTQAIYEASVNFPNGAVAVFARAAKP